MKDYEYQTVLQWFNC